MTQRFARIWAFAATTLVPALAFAHSDGNCRVPTGTSSVPELDPSSAVAAFTLLAAAALYLHRKRQTRV